MSLILIIDTSLETAFVAVAKDGILISSRINENQKDHASFLGPAIQSITKETGIELTELSAVAVVNGPGSYTGLRVGMASAKGLCYALNKPLMLLNNLELLSIAAILEQEQLKPNTLFCPMIDARRMEVYTAVYDNTLTVIKEPCALILQTNSFSDLLKNDSIIFFGNGSNKWKSLCDDKNARFIEIKGKNKATILLSFQKLAIQLFTSLVDAQPLYIKEFYTTQNAS
jgi:tRNA threonylcarbamoyladenosine biosynthesis protein TsaB